MSGDGVRNPHVGANTPVWFGHLLEVILAPVLRTLYRTRVMHAENIPANGGYILAANHMSYLDPVLLWCVSPVETHFAGKSELFRNKLVSWIITRVWAFPINRDSPDREAIQYATSLLVHGKAVGMFPEGTRRRMLTELSEDGLGPAHSGVAFIAMRAGVPIIPVGISGTDRVLPPGAKIPRFPRVTFCFGEPVSDEDFPQHSRKEKTDAMTETVMRRIAAARDAASEG